MERAARLPVGSRLPLLVLLLVLLASAALPGHAETRPAVEVSPDWRFVTGGRIRQAPAVSADGTIYFVSDDRLLRALSDRGKELWRLPLGARPASSPLVAPDGSIYVVTADRTLSCVGAQGRGRFSRTLESQPVAGLAAGRDGSLYVPLASGSLSSLDYRGRERWTFRFKAEIAAAPSVGADGAVYVSTADRLFHALSPQGTERWTVSLPANGGGAALGSGGTIYVSAFGIHAFSPDGRLLWDLPVSSPTGDPVVGPDPSGRTAEIVVVAARNGSLHTADALGGRASVLELGGEVVSPPVIRPDGKIVLAGSAGIYRVDPFRSDEPSALVRVKAAAGAPVLTPGGLALVGSEDWVLYACGFGDTMEAEPGMSALARFWPQARHDATQSGRAQGRAGPSIDFLLLRELESSGLPSLRESVLLELERHFAGREFLPLDVGEIEELLGTLALEGAMSPIYVGERPFSADPVLRARSCALLGELGTEGARRILLTVVEKDPRLEVQSSAADALGRVGYDPDGQAARILRALAERRRSDVGFLLVAVRALRGLGASGGPTLGLGEPGPAPGEELSSRPAWEALVALTGNSYPERVRAAARSALSELQADARR